MSRRGDSSLRMSSLRGGLNRFQQDAGPQQYIDGLDVLADTGDLRRREAYVPVGSGAPHLFPAGVCSVVTSDVQADGLGGFSTAADRTPSLVSQFFLYVGVARTPTAPWGFFSGIDFRQINQNQVLAQHKIVRPEYWNGSAWTRIAAWVDETRDISNGYFGSLLRDGRIYWHLPQIASSWAKATINTINAFWVRLRFQAYTDFVSGSNTATALSTGGTHTFLAPGIRVFALAPVNGLFSVRINNRSTLMIGSDRDRRLLNANGSPSLTEDCAATYASGLELGAQLGAKMTNALETKSMLVLDDEGPAVYGVQTWPRPLFNGAPIGAPGLTYGTAARIKKTREAIPNGATGNMDQYLWFDHQFRGGLIGDNPAAVPPGLVDTAGSVTRFSCLGATARLKTVDGWYRHVRLRCVARTAGGPAVGEEVEGFDHRYSAGSHVWDVYPAWTAIPDANNRFIVLAPHSELDLAYQKQRYEIRDNSGSHLLEPAVRPYASDPSNIAPTNPLYFRIGKSLRWIAEAGETWVGVIDPVTGRFFCGNGRTPMLDFDGYHIRRVRPDFTSALALAITGQTPDSAETDADVRAIAKSQLRQQLPPPRLLAIHRQRFFMVGPEPLRVLWSEAQIANGIWPMLNEDIVRDAEQDPIRGMISFNDRLIIWTATAIHEAVDTDAAPYFTFQQVARSIGFVGPNAVCVVAGRAGNSYLMGVAPDGLYSWAMGEPEMVLDNWERLIDGGVNLDRVARACSVYAPQKACCFHAVPARGSSVNNRLIRHDIVRESFDVWTCPFGVRSLGVDTDELGRERLLIGTEDGYVMTLGDAADDDGVAINAYALSPFVGAADGSEVALVGALIQARTVGATSAQQMSFDIHVDGNSRRALHNDKVTASHGAPNFGSGSSAYSAAGGAGAIPQPNDLAEFEINAASADRGHSFAYRVSGACRWMVRGVVMKYRKLARSGRL